MSLPTQTSRSFAAIGVATALVLGAGSASMAVAAGHHGHSSRVSVAGAGVRGHDAGADSTRSLLSGTYQPSFDRLSGGHTHTLKPRSLPVVTGRPVVGSRLQATSGEWKQDDITIAFQWLADGHRIPGATSTSYTATGSDVGRSLAVSVTASKRGFRSTTITSEGTDDVARPRLRALSDPRISGIARVGTRLEVGRMRWSVAPASLDYRWRDATTGRAIPGANRASYTPSARYAGDRLAVVVTATRPGYTAGQASTLTPRVKPARHR